MQGCFLLGVSANQLVLGSAQRWNDILTEQEPTYLDSD